MSRTQMNRKNGILLSGYIMNVFTVIFHILFILGLLKFFQNSNNKNLTDPKTFA